MIVSLFIILCVSLPGIMAVEIGLAREERDDARRRAKHWRERFEVLREQLAILPARDPSTGRYMHRDHP